MEPSETLTKADLSRHLMEQLDRVFPAALSNLSPGS
jgi:hypothetical protein